MIDSEIHFFRADGTLGLRVLAAAANHDEILLAVAKMRSPDFASVKVWRGMARDRVRHRPVMTIPEAEETRPGPGPRNFRL